MNSFLSYVGGKSKLADRIVGSMPKHKLYCEVFAGAAWVYFRKDPSTIEVLNDKNSELTNLYRVIKHHLPEFVRQFNDVLVSRDEFVRCKTEAPSTLTDVQRAVRYYYLLRLSYGGKVADYSFTISRVRRLKLRTADIEESLKLIHDRLNNTVVENLNYDKCIAQYDSPGTLFYLDPPYWNCEDYYGKNLFERADFERIANILGQIQGKFIVSINNVPEIREIFKAFIIREVETAYSLGTNNQPITELLITNY